MPDRVQENKAAALISHINAALTNIRLYPPASALIQSSVSRLNAAFDELFEESSEVVYAESEKKLLVQGEPLSEKEQKRPQVQAFLGMLLDLGIKSLTFERGLTEAELNAFLESVGRGAAGGEGGEGGAEEVGFEHIRIDEKIFVERPSDQSIIAGMDISDEEIARAVFGEQAVSEDAKKRLREMANNPEWVARVFQAGVCEVLSPGAEAGSTDVRKQLSGMIDSLDALSAMDRQQILRNIGESMAEAADAEVFDAFARHMVSLLGPQGFQEMVHSMEEEQFRAVYQRLVKLIQSDPKGVDSSIRQTLEMMGRAGREKLHAKPARGQAESEAGGPGSADASQGRPQALKAAFSRLFQGDPQVLRELSEMGGMERAVEKVAASGRENMLAALSQRLLEGLKSPEAAVRDGAASVMAALDRSLAAQGRTEKRMEMAGSLVEWVRHTSEMSKAFETVSRQLQNTAESLIQERRFQDAAPILEAYELMDQGNLSKEEAIQALSANLLQNLATDEIIELLLQEKRLQNGEPSEKDVYSLVLLGTTTVERLLDRLHESQNRAERNRVIQAVTRIGEPAVKPVVERLGQDGPWYYHRNLILILGRIGSEAHVEILDRFLGHSDFRVQREAVLAIQNLGGEQAGAMLLKRIEQVSDEVKPVVVSVLGLINYQQALPYLVMKLEKRDLGATREAKAAVNAKICEALARIGDARAIPLLEKVASSKKFMGSRAYDPKVKTAAARALEGLARAGAG
jgi:HEAT repeat protein